MEKYHIEKNTVQETLIIPLYGRKICSDHFPGLFSDPDVRWFRKYEDREDPGL